MEQIFACLNKMTSLCKAKFSGFKSLNLFKNIAW